MSCADAAHAEILNKRVVFLILQSCIGSKNGSDEYFVIELFQLLCSLSDMCLSSDSSNNQLFSNTQLLNTMYARLDPHLH